MGRLTVVVAAAHLAVAINPGDRGAIAQRYGHLARLSLPVQERLDGLEKLLDALPAQRRDRELAGPIGPRRRTSLQDAPPLGRHGIDLVQRLDQGCTAALLDCP